jgi:hypothetical protein
MRAPSYIDVHFAPHPHPLVIPADQRGQIPARVLRPSHNTQKNRAARLLTATDAAEYGPRSAAERRSGSSLSVRGRRWQANYAARQSKRSVFTYTSRIRYQLSARWWLSVIKGSETLDRADNPSVKCAPVLRSWKCKLHKRNRQIHQENDPNHFEHKHDTNRHSRPNTLEPLFSRHRCGAAHGRRSGVGIWRLQLCAKTSRLLCGLPVSIRVLFEQRGSVLK